MVAKVVQLHAQKKKKKRKKLVSAIGEINVLLQSLEHPQSEVERKYQ